MGATDGRVNLVMDCVAVRRSYSGYLDRRLPETDRVRVERHLEMCRECAAQSEQLAQVRSALRALPAMLPPPKLDMELRVLASHEQARARQSWLERWMDRARLVIDNLMRPLALPFAGGLASAVFLFGALMPNLGFPRNVANDVATPLYREAAVDVMPDFVSRNKSSDDTLIEVEIDGQGRMVDYYLPQGQMNSDLANMLLFTTYTPATMFGQPTAGKIILRRSRIVVKG